MSSTPKERSTNKPNHRSGASGDGGAEVTSGSVARALEAFTTTAATLQHASQVDDLLRAMARQVAEMVGVERSSILLRDERAGLFRGCVGHAPDRDIDVYVKRSLAGMPADGMTRELLRTKQPVIVANARNDPRIMRSTVRFWNIHSIMAVPMLFGDEVIGLIHLDDEDRPHVFSASDAEIATAFARLAAVAVTHAQTRIEMCAKLDAAERQIKTLRRAAAVDERLSDLVLADSSLGELVETLAQLLGKPCAVYGAGFEPLASANAPGGDDGLRPRLLEPPCIEQPDVIAALEAGLGSRTFLVGPLPDSGVPHRHLVAPILAEEECWGHLVVMEHKGRFSGGDMLTARRAATLVALQMTSERRAAEADWNASASLVAELLDGCTEPASVQRRAARVGVRLDTPHVVAVIGSRAGDADRFSDFRAVAAAFREAAPELTVHATSAAAGVVALLEVPADVDDADCARSFKHILTLVCERLGGTSQVAAGLSSVCSEVTGYGVAYAEARQVLDCIRRFGSPEGPGVFAAAELGTGRVFLATSDAAAVTDFALATFGALVRDASKIDLLATLGCFFDNMMSIRRCAVQLGVHENTIRYRLARVEELTGLSVTHDPDALLGARLSLLVLMLRGCLATEPLPDGAGADEPRTLDLVKAMAG